MRRKDREITSFDEQLKIIDQCDVVRLGLVDDDGYPYILPLNFGYEVIDDDLVLYFHGALEGYKYELNVCDVFDLVDFFRIIFRDSVIADDIDIGQIIIFVVFVSRFVDVGACDFECDKCHGSEHHQQHYRQKSSLRFYKRFENRLV